LSEIEGITFNRIKEHLCVFCGEDLLGEAEMGMHSECRKKVEKIARKQIANRKEREGKVKQLKLKVSEKYINRKP
jgi:hypothetical protein